MIEKLKKTVYDNKKIILKYRKIQSLLFPKLGFDPLRWELVPWLVSLREKVENVLATKILSGELKKGDTFTINPEDIG